MRSRVEIVADVADDGTPLFARLCADGALAVRRTGPARVHLVGTAAGPLDGDVVEVDVAVRAGALLTVEGVAATIALPGIGQVPATWTVTADVAAGGGLVCVPQPLVVCAGARLLTRMSVTLAGDASLDLVEQVVLGRFGEPGGDWTGRILADVDGAPVLRQSQSAALLTAGPQRAGDAAPRAIVSRLLFGAGFGEAAPAVHGDAVACPLAAGGLLLTALGPDLGTALRDLGALGGSRLTTPAVQLSHQRGTRSDRGEGAALAPVEPGAGPAAHRRSTGVRKRGWRP
jgi:urease accessory protein